MIRYFNQNIINTINRSLTLNFNTLSQTIPQLYSEVQLNKSELEIQRQSLSFDDPIIQTLEIKNALLNSFITLFEIYFRYLSESFDFQQPYETWINSWNTVYQSAPIDVIDGITLPPTIDTTSQEFLLLQNLIGNVSGGQSTPNIDSGDTSNETISDDETFGFDYYYYPVSDIETAKQIRRTMILPIPYSPDSFLFLKDEADVKTYFKAYPPYTFDDNSNKIMTRDITLVVCGVADNIITRLPDFNVSDGWNTVGVVKWYVVDKIYQPRIVVLDFITYPITTNSVSSKNPIRRRVGTGRG